MRSIGNIERFLVIGIVVVIGAILAVAIRGADDLNSAYRDKVANAKSPDPKKGGTLKWAVIGEPPAHDPVFTTATVTANFLATISSRGGGSEGTGFTYGILMANELNRAAQIRASLRN